MCLLLTANLYAADQKISALGAVNPANADTIYVIQGGVSSKATVSNLFAAGTDLDADGVIAANSVALGADTTGNYVATVADSGAGEVTVAGSGAETAAVTLAIGAGLSRTTHRHEGEVLSLSGLGATNISGTTVKATVISGNSVLGDRFYADSRIGGALVTGNTVSGNTINVAGAYTFPVGDGTNGYTLKTNGSGAVTWQADNNSGGGASGLNDLTGYSTAKVLVVGGLGTSGTISASTVTADIVSGNTVYAWLLSGNTVTANTVNVGGFGRLPAYQSKSFVLVSPNSVMSMSIWRVPYAITMRRIDVLCQGGTNIVGGLDECDGNGLNPVAVDSDITGTLMTNVKDDGALTNPGLDAGDYLKWHTTSTSGNVSVSTVTFQFTIDTGTQIP